MDDLKKLFDAVRAFEGDSLDEACEELEVSRTFLHQYFHKDATSAPLTVKLIDYITHSDLYEKLRELKQREPKPATTN